MIASFGDGNEQPLSADFGTVQVIDTGGGVSQLPRKTEVTLYADAWQGADGKFKQIVDVPTATENSKVDIQLSDELIEFFHEKDIGLDTENDGGIVTFTVYGDKPTINYVVQVTLTEVEEL